MTELLHHPIVRGALAGWLTAAAVDFDAFRKWNSFQDAKAYSWGTATWRWLQGVIVGAATAAGLDLAVGS